MEENAVNAMEHVAQLEQVIEGLADTAKRDEEAARRKFVLWKVIIICLCIVVSIGFICGAALGIYAIDRNFSYLESIVVETETRYELETHNDGDGNAVAFVGDSNNVSGGDSYGNGEN